MRTVALPSAEAAKAGENASQEAYPTDVVARNLIMIEIPCRLPPGHLLYARSPDFTPTNLPAALRAGHATKPGVWGLLRVTEGIIRFELEPPRQGSVVARAGESVVIPTEVDHHVEFIEAGRFHVEFYRAA